MSRISLIYSEKDLAVAEKIARLLEETGLEVWWDRKIPIGRSYSDVFKEAVETADCIIVLWSRSSVEKEWIKAEAEEGLATGKLVPIVIDDVDLPLGFRQIQPVNFVDWDGSRHARAFQSLLSALKELTIDYFESELCSGPAIDFDRTGGFDATLQRPRRGMFGKIIGAITGIFKRVCPSQPPTEQPPVTNERGRDENVYFECRDEWEPMLVSASRPVQLGVAAPRQVALGSSFTARFAAYIAAARATALEHLKELGAEGDRVITDIPPDREAYWRVGAPVSVRLTGDYVSIAPEERTFEWNGRENLVSFIVRVNDDAPQTLSQLVFHVFLGPLQIAFIPLSVTITARPSDTQAPEVEVLAPSSVFASYSSKDAESVSRSLSTLAHWAPTLDIFQDCLDLKPNESFKPRLEEEITQRDVFLLFWSRNAKESKWVLWEFDTARAKKGLDAILPMPLEDPSIAPPPPGFEEKHLRDRYMIAGYGLKKIAETTAGNSPQSA
jgi:hypothetical protein